MKHGNIKSLDFNLANILFFTLHLVALVGFKKSVEENSNIHIVRKPEIERKFE